MRNKFGQTFKMSYTRVCFLPGLSTTTPFVEWFSVVRPGEITVMADGYSRSRNHLHYNKHYTNVHSVQAERVYKETSYGLTDFYSSRFTFYIYFFF